jgi:hypothetical protein
MGEDRAMMSGWMGRFVNDVIKLWPIFLCIGIWIVRVEVFMGAGERFTPTMHEESVNEAWTAARQEFVNEELYDRDRQHLAEDLTEIKETLQELRDDQKAHIAVHNGGTK